MKHLRYWWEAYFWSTLVVAAVVGSMLITSGCTTTRWKTRTVKVPVVQYEPIPAELTHPCPKAKPRNDTVAEAVSVAIARGACVDRLNGQMKAIRSIPEPTSLPGAH